MRSREDLERVDGVLTRFFAIKSMVEKYLGKDRILHAALSGKGI